MGLFNNLFANNKEESNSKSTETSLDCIMLSYEDRNALKEEIIEQLRAEFANIVEESIRKDYLNDINEWCDARFRKKLAHEKKSLTDYINDKYTMTEPD